MCVLSKVSRSTNDQYLWTIVSFVDSLYLLIDSEHHYDQFVL